MTIPEHPPGPGVDAYGQAVVDPTQNVRDLVNAAVLRLDDLRDAHSRHGAEVLAIRAAHYIEMRDAEGRRIDAIRAVDVAAVQQAAQVSATQASTLAAQVATSAETLRTQVAAAATASTVALAAALEPIQKDIADLRRAQYEAQGVKSQTIDERSSSGAVWAAVGVIVAAVAVIVSVAVAILTTTTR